MSTMSFWLMEIHADVVTLLAPGVHLVLHTAPAVAVKTWSSPFGALRLTRVSGELRLLSWYSWMPSPPSRHQYSKGPLLAAAPSSRNTYRPGG